MTTMHDDNYSPLYGWLLLFGLLLTGAFLLWHFGLLQQLHEQDRTSLSIVILALFVLTTLYLGWCALRLSQENRLAQKPDADAGTAYHPAGDSCTVGYMGDRGLWRR
ncbi:MAG: hypothetical protein P8Z31_03790 [Gammaproteobacteria bacterium]